MMMVSETPESSEKQEGGEDSLAKEIMEVDKDNESIHTFKTSSKEVSIEEKSQGLLDSSKACIDENVMNTSVDELITNKNINVFGAGFFMMYKEEDSEEVSETKKENHLVEETE